MWFVHLKLCQYIVICACKTAQHHKLWIILVLIIVLMLSTSYPVLYSTNVVMWTVKDMTIIDMYCELVEIISCCELVIQSEYNQYNLLVCCHILYQLAADAGSRGMPHCPALIVAVCRGQPQTPATAALSRSALWRLAASRPAWQLTAISSSTRPYSLSTSLLFCS